MSNEHAIDWQALSAPFDPADVDFRPQGKPSANGNVQVVAYVDARTVMARLDEACGPDGWSFTWEPIVVERGQVQIAKGRLTIGGVVREDVGEASNFDPSKGCVSDTLKRVAVQFGVARYLYDIERTWVKASGDRLDERIIAGLRERLPRPDGAQPVTLSELQEVVRHTPVRGGSNPPAPAQSSFAARPPVLHAPVNTSADKPAVVLPAVPGVWPAVSAPAAPKSGAASDEQRERMRQQRNILHILDKTVERADNILNARQADERIKAYDQRIADRQREGARA